jgi:hypothetical protein
MMCTPEQAAAIQGVPVSKWFTEIEPLQKHLKEIPETTGYTFRLTGAKGEVLYGFCVAIMKEVVGADSSAGSGSAPKSPRSNWASNWFGGSSSSPSSKGNRVNMTSKISLSLCGMYSAEFNWWRVCCASCD